MKTLFIIMLFVGLLICACSPASSQQTIVIPTLAVLPTDGPSPTLQPPTVTPTPSNTLIPSTTPSPTLSPVPPCDVSTWWDKSAKDFMVQFLDTAEVASKTPRMSMGTIILQLRQVQRQFEKLDHPDCLRDIYLELSSAMDETVSGFTDFMGQSDIASQVELGFASQYFWNANQMLGVYFVAGDMRMASAAAFIWGGDSPNALTATWLINVLTPTATFTPSATFTPTKTPNLIETAARATVDAQSTRENLATSLRFLFPSIRDLKIDYQDTLVTVSAYILNTANTQAVADQLHNQVVWNLGDSVTLIVIDLYYSDTGRLAHHFEFHN